MYIHVEFLWWMGGGCIDNGLWFLTCVIRQGPAQDVPFALILWYIAKTIPTFYEFSLYLSRI